jgi:hypothetical protein
MLGNNTHTVAIGQSKEETPRASLGTGFILQDSSSGAAHLRDSVSSKPRTSTLEKGQGARQKPYVPQKVCYQAETDLSRDPY